MEQINHDESESDLVVQARANDDEAFEKLVKRHRRAVYAQCLKIVRDPEEAEDRVQEAFVKAHTALSRFRGDAKFSTWVHAIARNGCLMKLRKRKLHTVSLDRPVEFGDGAAEREVPDCGADPATLVLRKEFRELLEERVGKLSLLNRSVFEMRVKRGLSTAETARELGLSQSAVKSRLHRARLNLRAALWPYVEHGSLPA